MSLHVKLWNLVGGTVAISVNDENVLFTELPPGGLQTTLDLGGISVGTKALMTLMILWWHRVKTKAESGTTPMSASSMAASLTFR
jgi:hypothetical protein